MKSDYLFLAPYPTKENIKDGMMSRINAIDELFKDYSRIYLEVALFRYWKKKSWKDGNATIYQINSFTSIFLIFRLLLSAKKIYSHSIWMCLGIFYILPFLKPCIILDAHGVVPEEVVLYTRKKIKAYILNFIERLVISKCLCIICVTKCMQKHFEKKYPNFSGKYIVYSIFPKNIKNNISLEELLIERKDNDSVCVIYSGGVSEWQNIDLMLDSIKSKGDNHINYIILVNNKDYINKKIREKSLYLDKLEVLSVMPEELALYYKKADYAFILRDDNVVNRVANPTKMVEYLSFGVVPIVLSEYIGDYVDRKYEYISLNDFLSLELTKTFSPSIVNMGIAQELLEENDKQDLFNSLTKIWDNFNLT